MAAKTISLSVTGDEGTLDSLLRLCAKNHGYDPVADPKADPPISPIDRVKAAMLRFLRESAQAEAIKEAHRQASDKANAAMSAAADSLTSELTVE